MNLDASISVTTIIYSRFYIDKTKLIYTIILSGGMKIFGVNKGMRKLFKLKLLCDLMTNDFMYEE